MPESDKLSPQFKRIASSWAFVLPMMKAGGRLTRDAQTKRYYVGGNGSFTDRQVATLEHEGLIKLVGAFTYALVES